MEHQDTKLTSMRPRLKELNDNPYVVLGKSRHKFQIYISLILKPIPPP